MTHTTLARSEVEQRPRAPPPPRPSASALPAAVHSRFSTRPIEPLVAVGALDLGLAVAAHELGEISEAGVANAVGLQVELARAAPWREERARERAEARVADAVAREPQLLQALRAPRPTAAASAAAPRSRRTALRRVRPTAARPRRRA